MFIYTRFCFSTSFSDKIRKQTKLLKIPDRRKFAIGFLYKDKYLSKRSLRNNPISYKFEQIHTKQSYNHNLLKNRLPSPPYNKKTEYNMYSVNFR